MTTAVAALVAIC